MSVNLYNLYNVLFKKGISDNRDQLLEKNSYGKIACASSKEAMIKNRGFTVGSIETLMSNKQLTHFTPNVFNYLSRKNGVVSGHSEENLKQINTFVIDFDNPKATAQDIMNVALDINILPTFLVKTDKGYHAYFVLEKPVFVSKKTDYKSLQIAKKISQNLRQAFSKKIKGVDLICNHFGYFRFPNKNNIEYLNLEETHNFKVLMNWSMKYTDDVIANFKLVVDNTIHSSKQQIKEAWYRELITQAQIYAGHGYGRNNTVFTLSLANYQSGISYEDCLNKMDEFNTYLEYPLHVNDVNRAVKSAYSGKYYGANKYYIDHLMETWTNKSYKSTAFNPRYKHKKARHERVYSKQEEREQDILAFINDNAQQGVVEISLSQLANVFNVSKATIIKVINASNQIFTKVIGKGRYAVTKIYSLISLVQHVKNKSTGSLFNHLEMENIYQYVEEEQDKKRLESIVNMFRNERNKRHIEQRELLL
ncbi:primase C-terminal domain-containing protein [Nosocomiicoccus sp. HMSC059G07]|uniref:primase C-terminal domain-containing protein n=1 Tax=Nosocomiicoccus sp. HMSC059G07 TaxID=1739531 RepID=UPI0008A15ADB|nr:primase C-terminal domain-containing protein [Nosocomiicoccus sp. HMSC059G07]OFO55318.1 hypothetical protein HMPREF3029_04675 [Nosocomiicoccus sp. HMSC059G07]